MNNNTDTLRAHNLKATPQRIEIADALYAHGHLSIDKLYDLLLQKFASISLATIYKNINLMLEAAFIQEVKIPNAKSVYELTKASHSHIACIKCGEIEDITLNLSCVEKDASALSSFTIKHTDLIFSGICKNCQ